MNHKRLLTLTSLVLLAGITLAVGAQSSMAIDLDGDGTTESTMTLSGQTIGMTTGEDLRWSKNVGVDTSQKESMTTAKLNGDTILDFIFKFNEDGKITYLIIEGNKGDYKKTTVDSPDEIGYEVVNYGIKVVATVEGKEETTYLQFLVFQYHFDSLNFSKSAGVNVHYYETSEETPGYEASLMLLGLGIGVVLRKRQQTS